MRCVANIPVSKMVKIALQIKATFENIEKLAPKNPGYNYLLKIKCSTCGESSNKWHDVNEDTSVQTTRSTVNFLMKCKFCSRENSLDVMPNSNGEYTSDDQGSFKTIIIFDCRGIEPQEFAPGPGWNVKVEESNKTFEDVDLTDKEWVEYDEKSQQSVGIYEFESKFIKVK